VIAVRVRDAAMNERSYTDAALEALGRVRVEVENKTFDNIAPEMTSASVLTPTVSLSRPPRGEYPTEQPRVGLSVMVSDSGTTNRSGVSGVEVVYCSESGWDCMYLDGTPLTYSTVSAQAIVGAQLWSEWMEPSVYRASYVTVRDSAGNSMQYYDVREGGDTDLEAMGFTPITFTE